MTTGITRALSVATAVAAGAAAAPVLANPIAYGTISVATADASAINVQLSDSTISVLNGAITNNSINQPPVGAGTTSAGGSSAFVASAAATEGAGSDSSAVSAVADLAGGTLHGLITPSGTGQTGGGTTSASIGDVVTFHNTSGATATVGVTYSIHGAFTAADGQTIAAFNTGAGRSVNGFLEFQELPGTNLVQLRNLPAFADTSHFGDFYANLDFNGTGATYTDNGDGNVGVNNIVALTGTTDLAGVDVAMVAQLLVPTGVSSIDIGARLDLRCGPSDCDFSHTATLGFDALPLGLSYGSQSGVFLTGGAAASVPEPASIAVIVLGLLGTMVARRRRALDSGIDTARGRQAST